MRTETDNILVIGDTHEPFSKKKYLEFCYDTGKRFKCSLTVHIGDLVDNHSINYHEHYPDGMSPFEEIKAARKKLKEWYKAFPRVMMCKGNHDILVERKAITYGFSEMVIKQFREIWEIPDGWEYQWSYDLCGVRFEHGTGYSGQYPHQNIAKVNRKSTVIGHCHSVAGVAYMANDNSLIFGMSTGSGIDRQKYAFWYGRAFKNKPIIGCGVVLNCGKEAQFIPMKL